MFGSSREVNIVINAEDKASRVFENFGSIGSKALKGIGIGVGAAAAAVTAFGISSVKSYKNAAKASDTLRILTLNQTGATEENVKALEAQADAIAKVGITDDDSIKAAQAKLTTFDLQTDAIQRLIPGLVDMTQAERQGQATTEDFVSAAENMGRALTGNTANLERQGFQFTDFQKKILETGTTQEKLNVITEVMGNTYGGFNEKIAQTPFGKIEMLSNKFDELKERFGSSIVDFVMIYVDRLSQQFTDLQENWELYVRPEVDDLKTSFDNLKTSLGEAGVAAGITEDGTFTLTDAVTTAIKVVDGMVRATDAVTRAWNGAVEGLSSFFAWIIITKGKVEEFFSPLDRLKSKLDGVSGAMSAVGNVLTGNIPGLINQFTNRQHGGVVPGRPGQAVPIIAHGGEMVSNPALGQTTNNDYKINVSLNSEAAVSLFFRELQNKEVGRRFGVA